MVNIIGLWTANGFWSMGRTDWVVIGDAGTSGIGLIKNVREDVENNSVIIELSDREIVIPKGQNFALVIKADEIGIKAGETVNVEYSLISADNAIVRGKRLHRQSKSDFCN